MTRKFRNPANGHIEEVGAGSSIAAFFFCVPYLLVKGLWTHFAIVMLFFLPLTIGAGPGGGLLASLALGFVYAFSIQPILANRFLRKGWIEVNEAIPLGSKPDANVRKCPYCAEEILREAIRCKHCHANVEALSPIEAETIDETAERLGIKRAGNLYLYQDHQYTRLDDAVSYAKHVNGETT